MNLQHYKIIFVAVVLLVSLFVASPALQRILVYPSNQSDSFTELWLYGPEKNADNYPYNITSDNDYSVYLGIGNQLGSCAYYQVNVKFCNSTLLLPSSFNRTSSTQPSLYSINAFVPYKETLEIPITFSFNYSYVEDLYCMSFNKLTVNGIPLSLQGSSATWDFQKDAFYGNLFFELWIYNSTTNAFQYHDRYVSLQLNMTGTL
jgi:uncharacterized membrane protein